MQIKKLIVIPLVSLFIGCGSSENEIDIDNINIVQEKLLQEDAQNIEMVEEALPSEIRDKGNKNGEN